jgi:transcriptional regulator with XRE-family HTH domain
MSITSERLKQAISEANIKQVELCERTGISKGALSSYLSGRYDPKQNNIYILANVLDVNPAWLMGYNVPKRELHIRSLPAEPVELTPEQKELLNIYDSLNDSGRAEALKRLKELSELERYKSVRYTMEEYEAMIEDMKKG